MVCAMVWHAAAFAAMLAPPFADAGSAKANEERASACERERHTALRVAKGELSVPGATSAESAHSRQCVLQPPPWSPYLRRGVSWNDMLDKHSGGFNLTLVLCAPSESLDASKTAQSYAHDPDVDKIRIARGVQAVRDAAPYAHMVEVCMLLLASEICRGLQPEIMPAVSNTKAFPAVVVFREDAPGVWRGHQRTNFEARRMSGCGLQAECFLLDAAGLAGSKEAPAGSQWLSLSTPWPMPAKLSSQQGSSRTHVERQPLKAAGPQSVEPPTIAECLLSFTDEVVRLRPMTKHKPYSPDFGSLDPPVFVLHYVGLKLRKRQMRKRLQAAGLASRSTFVEMKPDHVNDTMWVCLGAQRRKSIDSMSDNPVWRLPTRGEDSLAIKHLAVAIWLVRSALPHALVLEDDVWFSQHFATDLREILVEAQGLDWDVIAVGTCFHHRTPFGRQLRPHLWLTQIMPCAHAYLLSQSGARAVLKTLPLELPIDLQINLIAQDGAQYDDLRRAGAEKHPLPGEEYARILWAEPQLAFQWPADVSRSVERD